jgi:hypothetical protein
MDNVDETERKCPDEDVCELYDRLLSITPENLEASKEIKISSLVPLLTIVKFETLTSSYQTYANTFGIPLLRKLYRLIYDNLAVSDAIMFSQYDLHHLALKVHNKDKGTYSLLADRFWKAAGFNNATRINDPNPYITVGMPKGGAKKTTKKATKKTRAKK